MSRYADFHLQRALTTQQQMAEMLQSKGTERKSFNAATISALLHLTEDKQLFYTSKFGRFVCAPWGIKPAGSHAAMHGPPNVLSKRQSEAILGPVCMCVGLQTGRFGLCVFRIYSAVSAEFRFHRLLADLTALLCSLISPVNVGLQLIGNELASVSLLCFCTAVKGAHTLSLKDKPPTVCKNSSLLCINQFTVECRGTV